MCVHIEYGGSWCVTDHQPARAAGGRSLSTPRRFLMLPALWTAVHPRPRGGRFRTRTPRRERLARHRDERCVRVSVGMVGRDGHGRTVAAGGRAGVRRSSGGRASASTPIRASATRASTRSRRSTSWRWYCIWTSKHGDDTAGALAHQRGHEVGHCAGLPERQPGRRRHRGGAAEATREGPPHAGAALPRGYRPRSPPSTRRGDGSGRSWRSSSRCSRRRGRRSGWRPGTSSTSAR